MTLRLVDSDIVHMDKGTFMWIQLTHLAIETAQDDRSLLASLISSPAYAHDYASPFDAAAVVTEPRFTAVGGAAAFTLNCLCPGRRRMPNH